MKKVLIITYYWPPAGGPGVQRVLKLAKYLPRFGWQPVVLTVKNGDYPALDQSLEAEIPSDVTVYKIPIWEPYDLYRKMMGIKKSEPIPVAVLTQQQNPSFKSKMVRWLRGNIFIPDARISWYFNLVREAEKIIQTEDIQALFVSSPPHSLQLAGLKLKQKCNLPLVADFRDPWTDIYYYKDLKRLKLTRRIDSNLERKILRKADRVLTVSPALKRLFESKAPDTKCSVIYNGFDETDFDTIQSSKQEKFLIGYVGNFSANQNCPVLWNILQKLLESNSAFKKSFRLAFTGKIHQDIISSINENGLGEVTEFNDYKPHNEAIEAMRRASTLLFVIPDTKSNEGILSGKLFDYLASGTPLLSVGPPDGDAAEILSETGAGPMVAFDDEEGLKNRILRLFSAWQENSLNEFRPERLKIKKYERREMAGQTARLLDALCEEPI